MAKKTEMVFEFLGKHSSLVNSANQVKSKIGSMNSETDKSSKGFARFGGIAKKAFVGFTGVLSGAIAGLVSFGNSMSEVMDQLGKDVAKSDISADLFQKLSYAFERNGVSADKAQPFFLNFGKRLGELAVKQGELFTYLQKTNPALLEQVQAAGSTEEAFSLLSKSVQSLNGSARLKLSDALGLNELGQGLKDFDALSQEFDSSSFIISPEAIAAGETYQDLLANMNKEIAASKAEIFLDTSGALTDLTKLKHEVTKIGLTAAAAGAKFIAGFVKPVGKALSAMYSVTGLKLLVSSVKFLSNAKDAVLGVKITATNEQEFKTRIRQIQSELDSGNATELRTANLQNELYEVQKRLEELYPKSDALNKKFESQYINVKLSAEETLKLKEAQAQAANEAKSLADATGRMLNNYDSAISKIKVIAGQTSATLNDYKQIGKVDGPQFDSNDTEEDKRLKTQHYELELLNKARRDYYAAEKARRQGDFEEARSLAAQSLESYRKTTAEISGYQKEILGRKIQKIGTDLETSASLSLAIKELTPDQRQKAIDEAVSLGIDVTEAMKTQALKITLDPASLESVKDQIQGLSQEQVEVQIRIRESIDNDTTYLGGT